MILNEVAGIPVEALPITELRDHLRMGTGFSDEEFSWVINRWHRCDTQGLPIAPATSLEAVTLTGSDGDETAVDTENLTLARDSHRPKVMAKGAALPVIGSGGEAEIRFVAGYGTAWEDVPADLRQATLVLAATYFDYRHGESGGGQVIPFGVMALLEPYRAVRVSGGAR